MTRDVLRATLDLAQTRGARPLIVVPQFGVEDPAERALRLRILDEAGLPYVWIEIADGWRLSRSLHPNADAARAIATAIVSRPGRQISYDWHRTCYPCQGSGD